MKGKNVFTCLTALLLLTSMLIAGCDKSVSLQVSATVSPTEEGRKAVNIEPTEVPVTEKPVPLPTEESTQAACSECESEKVVESVPTETSTTVLEKTESPTTVPAEEKTAEEVIPPTTEAVEEVFSTTEPSVKLDYGAAMAYGNSYAADTYGCVYKPELDWHADGTGYDFGGDYFLEQIVNNGGQDMLNRLMADKVDATFGEWRFPEGCAGIGVECICYEEDGVVWFYVFYG